MKLFALLLCESRIDDSETYRNYDYEDLLLITDDKEQARSYCRDNTNKLYDRTDKYDHSRQVAWFEIREFTLNVENLNPDLEFWGLNGMSETRP